MVSCCQIIEYPPTPGAPNADSSYRWISGVDMAGPRPPVPVATKSVVNATGTFTEGGIFGDARNLLIIRGFDFNHR